jgi:hypothetical protein
MGLVARGSTRCVARPPGIAIPAGTRARPRRLTALILRRAQPRQREPVTRTDRTRAAPTRDQAVRGRITRPMRPMAGDGHRLSRAR